MNFKLDLEKQISRAVNWIGQFVSNCSHRDLMPHWTNGCVGETNNFPPLILVFFFKLSTSIFRVNRFFFFLLNVFLLDDRWNKQKNGRGKDSDNCRLLNVRINSVVVSFKLLFIGKLFMILCVLHCEGKLQSLIDRITKIAFDLKMWWKIQSDLNNWESG